MDIKLTGILSTSLLPHCFRKVVTLLLIYTCCLQDGTIGMDIKLTGILSTSLLSPGEASPSHGILVGPGVNAAHHQHLFNARLDMAVDDDNGGRNLVVSEVGTRL
jgi:primary-amine oxidase